jgi:hypothetical protein
MIICLFILYWVIGIAVVCWDWTENFDLDLKTFLLIIIFFCWGWPVILVGNLLPDYEFSNITIFKRRNK